ncbi:hypothetical protein Tco_0183401 [Tanacetum coccineum]
MGLIDEQLRVFELIRAGAYGNASGPSKVATKEQLVEVNTTTTRAENDSLMDQNFYGGSKDKCNYEAEILSLDGILELMVALEILISMVNAIQEARIAADKAYDVTKVDDRLNGAVECQQSCQCH